MVCKVAKNRFVSRAKRHICCKGVGSWSIVSSKVLNCSHGRKSFRLSIVNRYNSQKGVRYVNKRLLDL